MMLERAVVPPSIIFSLRLSPTHSHYSGFFSAGDHVSLWTRHPSLGQQLMTGSSLDHFQHTNTKTLILRIKFCLSVWHPHLLKTSSSPQKTQIDASSIHLLSSPFFFFFPSSPSFHLPLGIQSIVLEVDHLIGRPIRHFNIIGLS